MKFGKWEELIVEPFGDKLKIEDILKNKKLYCSTLPMVYFGRGVAYAVLAGIHQDKK